MAAIRGLRGQRKKKKVFFLVVSLFPFIYFTTPVHNSSFLRPNTAIPSAWKCTRYFFVLFVCLYDFLPPRPHLLFCSSPPSFIYLYSCGGPSPPPVFLVQTVLTPLCVLASCVVSYSRVISFILSTQSMLRYSRGEI